MAFLRSYYDQFTPVGKFWLTLGIVSLIVDAAISYKYGVSLTTLHGLGFALVAIFFALLPDQAWTEFESKRAASGTVLAILCIPLGIVALYSHLGYGASVRVGDVQQTAVQNAKYDGGREQVEEAKTSAAMFTKRLSTLEAERAALVAANPWAPTVSADGLKAQLAAMEGDMIFKRSKSCADVTIKESRSFCDKRADLQTRIGSVEKVNSLADDISKLNMQIDATRKVIASAREKADTTAYTSSAVVNQTNVAAQLFMAMNGADMEKAIDPDKVTFSFVNIFIAGAGSLAFMIMAPVGFFVAGRNRKRGAHSMVEPLPLPEIGPSFRPAIPTTPLKPMAAPNGVTVIEHKHTNDLRDTGLKDFINNLNAALERAKTQAA
jgi:hypothetical protein